MFHGQAPESGVGHGIQEIAQIKRGAVIAFPLQTEHGVWASVNIAVNHAGEMDTQKRKLRIGHRIDEVPN